MFSTFKFVCGKVKFKYKNSSPLVAFVPCSSEILPTSWCSLQSFSCYHYNALSFHIRWWITIRHCTFPDWSQLMLLLLYRNGYCVWVWLR